MGGTVGVRSTLGAGSEFWVRLPFNRVRDDQAQSEAASSLDVLVVSQDEGERQRLTQLCRSLGWRATPLFGLENLLEHLRDRLARQQTLADVLLLDHLAGDEVLQALEQLEALLGRERMPSSVMFSAPQASATAAGDGARVDHHTRTPLDGSDLYNAVAAASLRHPSGHSERSTPPSWTLPRPAGWRVCGCCWWMTATSTWRWPASCSSNRAPRCRPA